MNTPQQHIPINYTPTPDDHRNRGGYNGGPQLQRRHTARYYVHRVKESLTTRVSKLICSVFLSLLFIVGLITFILWLSLRPHRPRFHVHEFSFPSLAQDSGLASAQVTFNVTARNPNLNIGIYYDAMHIILYFQNQNIGEEPALMGAFYQSPKTTTILHGTLSGTKLVVDEARWAQFVAARMRGSVNFRLEVSSAIKFKVAGWESKKHKMHANCEIGVGPDGMLIASYSKPKCPVYFT
ncbi:putative Late embryogenesis abundant protein, LEA_2 subgroup [Helianthus anomalus]